MIERIQELLGSDAEASAGQDQQHGDGGLLIRWSTRAG